MSDTVYDICSRWFSRRAFCVRLYDVVTSYDVVCLWGAVILDLRIADLSPGLTMSTTFVPDCIVDKQSATAFVVEGLWVQWLISYDRGSTIGSDTVLDKCFRR